MALGRWVEWAPIHSNDTNLRPFRRATWRGQFIAILSRRGDRAMRTFAILSWAAWLAIAVLTTAVGVHAYGCAGAGDKGGNHAARLQGLHPTGEDLNAFKPAPSDKEIALELSFAMQHKDQFDELTRETQNPGSKQYQHWLTPEEMHARFGE